MKKTVLFLFMLSGIFVSALAQNTYTGTIGQIRLLTGTTYKQAASTDFGTGNWYLDPGDTTSPDNTGTVLVDASGNRWKRIYSGPIYVNWFGAKPDDSLNDSPAIQACFNNASPFQTIAFSKGTYNLFTMVTLTTTDVNLTGERANIVGGIKIGDTTPRTFNAVISGFTFATTGNAIQITNCRKLEIVSNVFNKSDKAIYITNEATAAHRNGIIEIKNNFFNEVNYCFYVDRNPLVTWMASNDCTFSGNVGNNVLITAVYCNGMDGLKYDNNTIFMPSDAARRMNKKHHLQIDNQSDWVVVANNNFFESGTESILVENCKLLNVTGNNFAWCGQANVYSVIKGTGVINDLLYNITGNVFDGFSGNVVELATRTYGMVNVMSNNINYSNTFTGYFGPVHLDTVMHYIIKAGSSSAKLFEKNNYNAIANLKSTSKNSIVSKYEQWGSLAANAYVSKSITTAGAGVGVDLFGLLDGNLSSSTYGGTLIITAKNSAASGANTSTYYLLLNKPSPGATPAPTVTVIQQAGLLSGAAASHPSFTFSISGTRLLATPVSSTSGTFYFYAQTSGSLIITE